METQTNTDFEYFFINKRRIEAGKENEVENKILKEHVQELLDNCKKCVAIIDELKLENNRNVEKIKSYNDQLKEKQRQIDHLNNLLALNAPATVPFDDGKDVFF